MCVVPTHLLTSRQRHRIIKTNSLGHLKSWLDCNVPSESHSDPYVLKIEPILHFSSAFGLEIFTSNATSLLKAPSLPSRKVMHYSEEWKTTRKKKHHMQILFESGTYIYYLPTLKADPRDICHMWLLPSLANIKSKPLKLSCTFFSSTELTFLCWRVNKWQDQAASGINRFLKRNSSPLPPQHNAFSLRFFVYFRNK